MIIGNKDFDLKNGHYIMGILNVTPDSFSDGGTHNTLDTALFQTEKMISEGAAVIDIGGESTRPGAASVSAEEEQERVLPVIEAVKARFDVPVSLDTYRASTAAAGIAAGVDLMNDIWGLLADPDMGKVIANAGIPAVLMHNRLNHEGYKDLIPEVRIDLEDLVQRAETAGIAKEKIILDPGIGFVKTTEENLQVMHHLGDLMIPGIPMLLGTSRKSMIGNTLQLPVDQRVEGTLVTTILGAQKGCCIFRVHDVKENLRALRMWEAIEGNA